MPLKSSYLNSDLNYVKNNSNIIVTKIANSTSTRLIERFKGIFRGFFIVSVFTVILSRLVVICIQVVLSIILCKSFLRLLRHSLSFSTTSSTALGVGAAAPVSVRPLEERLNKWLVELKEQEERFVRQAAHVNAWDQILQNGHDQVQALKDNLHTVKVSFLTIGKLLREISRTIYMLIVS